MNPRIRHRDGRALTPEEKERIEAILAKNRTPEAREKDRQVRDALEREYKETGTIAVRKPARITVGPYKGYTGTAEPEDGWPEWHGRVDSIRDVVTFVGLLGDQLEREFRESVDCYLQCNALDLLEDEIDRQAAAAALKDAEEHGTVPWEDVKKELGLSAPSAPPGDSSDSV